MKIAVAMLRVSSTKQGLQGDSPNVQKERILKRASEIDIQEDKIEFFNFVQSAGGEIQPASNILDYCKSNRNIKYFMFAHIDRMTRGGGFKYEKLLDDFTKLGIQLIDSDGVISYDTKNSMEHTGLEYEWSVYRPSKSVEIKKAEEAENERRTILTRMIGAEIKYTRQGWWATGRTQYGFETKKIETEHGKRCILVPNPSEAKWILEMFDLMASGYSSTEVVEKLNSKGFRSRTSNKRNKQRIVVGTIGGKPLNVKQLWRWIGNPIYAGYRTNHKWLDKPVKLNFKGLVSVELFNQANQGKLYLEINKDAVRLLEGKKAERYLKPKKQENPDFPYKKQINCHVCGHQLKGSAPRSKSGKHPPRYHCSLHHDYWSVRQELLHEHVDKFIENTEFNEEFLEEFLMIVMDEWKKRRKSATDDSVEREKYVLELKEKKQAMLNKILQLTSDSVIHEFEKQIEEVDEQIELAKSFRNEKEQEEVDIQKVLKHCYYYMEHLDELLIHRENPLERAEFLGLLFAETPTYPQIVDGTPEMSLLFKLNEAYKTSKNHCVTPQGIEPWLPG